MSKIYIVVSNQGEYEDFVTINEKAFINRQDAENYAKELDKKHFERPAFVTNEFINTYYQAQDQAYDSMDNWSNYPITEENRKAYDKFCDKEDSRYRQSIINYMYSKGFFLTEHMLEMYEEWDNNQNNRYGKCTIEEIELV